ncbi:MAG: response regulator [Persicimonas sp.]
MRPPESGKAGDVGGPIEVDEGGDEEVVRDLVEHSPDLVLCVDPGGALLYANHTTWEVLGYAGDERREQTLGDLLDEESREVFRDVTDGLTSGETVGPVELTLVDAEGKRLAVEGKLNGRIERGEPMWYRVVLRDLRDEKPERAVPRILVVEDDPVCAHMLSRMLERGGYQTEQVATGGEALEALAEEEFDAMTLDLALPDTNGADLLHEVRTRAENASLPVIVVSATADEAREHLTGDAAHVVDWLNKPFEPDSLRGAMTRAVSAGEGEKPCVLHVEDDAQFGGRVAEALSDMVRTDRVSTLSEARRKLQDSDEYDLVLLDLTLPDGLGAELLPFLNRPQGRSIPVILVSESEATDALAGHVADTLTKSKTSHQQLLDTIRAHLQD